MSKKRTGIIYKATNKINGKAYIGQTLYKINHRRSGHYTEARNVNDNNYFHNALKKYKKIDWKWSVLYKNISINQLNNMEVWCIANYDTFNSGYNSTSGGENGTIYTPELLEKMRIASTKHGKKYTKIYSAWNWMKNSCYNPNTKGYARNGAIGVKVCDRWLNSFETFYEDMGDKTGEGMILGRHNVKSDYCPSNCVWLTREEQSAFKTNTIIPISGYKGVYSSGNKWMARIRINVKKEYLGTFDTPEEASAVFNKRFIEHYGRLNKNED